MSRKKQDAWADGETYKASFGWNKHKAWIELGGKRVEQKRTPETTFFVVLPTMEQDTSLLLLDALSPEPTRAATKAKKRGRKKPRQKRRPRLRRPPSSVPAGRTLACRSSREASGSGRQQRSLRS